jgi:heptosyltransferase-1
MQVPRRILLVRLSHLGDIVHALPVYHALRDAYAEAEIAWVTQPEFAGLVRGLPGLARTILFGRREGAAAWLHLREDIASFAPDMVVDVQGNMKSAFCSLSAGSVRRVGLHAADWREALGALTATERAPRAEGEHAMDRMLALARHVGGDDAAGRLRADPDLSVDELALGRRLLDTHFPAAGPGAVILQLADPSDVRSWPVERFEELLGSLAERRATVLALSGPREAAIGLRVQESATPSQTLHHWVGQRGLRELAAVFTAAAERGVRFIGCDSGPMHLAAACGLPVTCLSGPQSSLRTGPWPLPGPGAPHRVLTATDAPSCAPCLLRTCSHTDGPVCMSRIDAERVLEELSVDVSARADMLVASGD